MNDGSLAALVLLGAFHGLNPAMGWLFAVARGLQERSRALVLQSLPAIAAGHAASIGAVAILVALTQAVIETRAVALGGGAVLVGFGLWRLLSRRGAHRTGRPVTLWGLTCWSFVMSSIHGAGLMLVPLLTTSAPAMAGHHDHGLAPSSGSALSAGVFVTCVHTLAMFIVAGVVAVLAYELAGPAVLRRSRPERSRPEHSRPEHSRFDLDRIWAVALVGAGAFTLLTAV